MCCLSEQARSASARAGEEQQRQELDGLKAEAAQAGLFPSMRRSFFYMGLEQI